MAELDETGLRQEEEYEYETYVDGEEEEEEEVHVMGDSARANDYEDENELTTMMEERAALRNTSSSQIERNDLLQRAAGYRQKDIRCNPVFQSGNLKISAAQAKLYGLLDENGKFKNMTPNEIHFDNIETNLKRLNAMSLPRELDLSHVVDSEAEEETFKPARSKEAMNAMRNPRCGYDFIDRLNNQSGSFLERMNGNEKTQNRMQKLLMETAKEDYLVSLEKLACPNCKRDQTFDEFWEKKRLCSACKVRYEKKNLCNAAAFEKRLRDQEEQRQARLREAEAKIYTVKKTVYSKPAAFTPVLKSHAAGVDNGGSSAEEMRADSRGSGRRGPVGSVDRATAAKAEAKTTASSASTVSDQSFTNPNQLLQKLARLNNEKAELLSAAVLAAEKKGATRIKETNFLAPTIPTEQPKAAAKIPASSVASETSKGSKRRDRRIPAPTNQTPAPVPAEPKMDKWDRLLS